MFVISLWGLNIIFACFSLTAGVRNVLLVALMIGMFMFYCHCLKVMLTCLKGRTLVK